MGKKPSRIKIRGIIVWDFDRVLFDTERFYRGAEKIFQKYGISRKILWAAVLKVRKGKRPFSVALVLEILRSKGVKVPEKKVRKEIHNHLAATRYFSSSTDDLLHRLRRRGFIHIILSHGSPSYLHKRVRIGCGKSFLRHFVKISATSQPKYLLLKKIVNHYPSLSVFFIDDTPEHLMLVKKHLPEVTTIHYSILSKKPLARLEKKILQYVKIKK